MGLFSRRDADGFDKNGFDKEGYDRDGFNKYGLDKDEYNKSGYKHGFDRNGNSRITNDKIKEEKRKKSIRTFITKKEEITLNVFDAYEKDIGKGVARIDYDSIDTLSVGNGPTIEIEGKKKTTAICRILNPSDAGKGIIRIDEQTRKNSETEIGDAILIRNLNGPRVESVQEIDEELTEKIDEENEDYIRELIKKQEISPDEWTVTKPDGRDSGSIVRIDGDFMAEMGLPLNRENIVCIINASDSLVQTYAICLPLFPSDSDHGMIRMTPQVRSNCKVEVNDSVRVLKVHWSEVERNVLKWVRLKQLTGNYAVTSDQISRDVFDRIVIKTGEQISAWGSNDKQEIIFEVMSISAKAGFGVITKETYVELPLAYEPSEEPEN